MAVILDAAKRLENREDLLFVLVGDGAKKNETLARITAERLGNVQVLDPVPKDQARHYLSAADIGLTTLLDIPLFHGAIPTKLLDYMACSLPVLCGIRGEAEQIMAKGRAGYCFEPNNSEALAAWVEHLAQSPEKRAEMGEAGLAYVRQHFSAGASREKMVRILLGAPKRRPAKRVKT
jgi:glycosyltransferase involved in cell wall biosynthesis